MKLFSFCSKAGIIDLGNDTIYIEPLLNTSLVVHRGWTRPGRPHLLYRKSVLERKEQHNLEFDELKMENFPTGLKGWLALETLLVQTCEQ